MNTKTTLTLTLSLCLLSSLSYCAIRRDRREHLGHSHRKQSRRQDSFPFGHGDPSTFPLPSPPSSRFELNRHKSQSTPFSIIPIASLSFGLGYLANQNRAGLAGIGLAGATWFLSRRELQNNLERDALRAQGDSIPRNWGLEEEEIENAIKAATMRAKSTPPKSVPANLFSNNQLEDIGTTAQAIAIGSTIFYGAIKAYRYFKTPLEQ